MLVRVHLLMNDVSLTERMRAVLEPLDVAVSIAPANGNFWDRLTESPADLIIANYSGLPKPVCDTIVSIGELPEEPNTILLWDEEDPNERAALLAAGCFAVLHSALNEEMLQTVLRALIERRREVGDDRLRSESDEEMIRLSDFETKSPVMRSFMRMVRRVVDADSSLLILGDTGVGKERLARAIHNESPRWNGPFIPVNCAAFPETLLDGELFGYEEGAFTGASGDRRGYFELAHGGTIFLDEIGELDKHLQVKLLRVLQERNIQRLGSEEVIPIDVRIMAATNRDLDEEIKAKRFRRDLYYRLGVVTLEVPSLKEHPEDIPELLDRYLEEFRIGMRRPVSRFSEDAVLALCRYSWPGNVRELINVVERAVLLCDGDEITLADLPATLLQGEAQRELPLPANNVDWVPQNWKHIPWFELKKYVVNACEKAYLTEHLRIANGRLTQVSKTTGLNPRTLFQMMRRQRLRKEDFRDH